MTWIEKCERGIFLHYISLGADCGVAGNLEKLGLRDGSYPFDWVFSSITGMNSVLTNQFNDFLQYENLAQKGAGKRTYKDTKYVITFPHDFSECVSLKKQLGGEK